MTDHQSQTLNNAPNAPNASCRVLHRAISVDKLCGLEI